MRPRVIALGQAAAGDDGVGPAVAREVSRLSAPDSVDVVIVAEASALLDLLATEARVVLVDALIGDPPGVVVEPREADLARGDLRWSGTHGLDVPEAIGLARTLAGDRFTPSLHVVAVTISAPVGRTFALSPAAAAAVPEAARRVLARLGVSA